MRLGDRIEIKATLSHRKKGDTHSIVPGNSYDRIIDAQETVGIRDRMGYSSINITHRSEGERKQGVTSQKVAVELDDQSAECPEGA
jgi:hypothetical protein